MVIACTSYIEDYEDEDDILAVVSASPKKMNTRSASCEYLSWRLNDKSDFDEEDDSKS
jgi:hypothetical protein